MLFDFDQQIREKSGGNRQDGKKVAYTYRMKNKPLTFLLALTFLISGSTIVNAKQNFGDYEGAIYVRNYDGDTITFNLPNLDPIIGKKIRVRLNGIDTPEIKGKCDKEKYDAEQAREMVEDILKDAENITLKNMQNWL